MRKISAIAQAKLDQKLGTEPINIVGIQWQLGTQLTYYVSKEITLATSIFNPNTPSSAIVIPTGPSITPETKVVSNILDITNLSSATRLDGSGSATQVTIKMLDLDGDLKNIINNNDVHRRTVYIYQHYADINVADAFLIFQGEIASPIIWSEVEKALTITAVTRLNSVPIGFSPESANMFNIHEDLIGNPWPMVFGTAIYYPAVPLQVIPTGTTVDPFGLPDHTIGLEQGKLMQQMLQDLEDAAINLFYAGLADSEGDSDAADSFNNTALALQQQANDIQTQIQQLGEALAGQLIWEKFNNRIVGGDRFPTNRLLVKVGETLFDAVVDAHPGEDGIAPVTWTPRYIGKPNPQLALSKQGFTFFQAGSSVQIINGISPMYVMSITPIGTPIVCCYRNANGLRKLTPVPSSYYSITNFGPGICVKFNRPMSSVSFIDNEITIGIDDYLNDIARDAGQMRPSHLVSTPTWEDQPYIIATSSIGPNAIDILIYLITTYTDKFYDSASFAHVRERLAAYPNNFVFFDRLDVYEMVNQVAYQNRCAVWLDRDIFYITYLPEEPDSQLTLTLDDFEEKSLEITSTGTEELITKYVGLWRPNYQHDKDNRVIIQHNVSKYGLIEQQFTYFCFNNFELVHKSATFWTIRKSNTWKIVKGKLFMRSLPLQIFDGVTLDFTAQNQQNIISNNPVKGVIQTINYNPTEKSIDITIWLPIRLGEMDPHPFAWPADLQESTFFPYFADVTSGNAGSGTFVNTITGSLPQYGDTVMTVEPTHQQPLDYGDKFPSDQGDGPYPFTIPQSEFNPASPNLPDYTYKEFPPIPQANISDGIFPGFIDKKLDRYTYSVNVYFDEFDPSNPSGAHSVKVSQMSIDPNETIPSGTPVFILRRITKSKKIQYTMNVPTWRE